MNTESTCPECAARARRTLRVGDVIRGYCGGTFGDSYGEKIVEHIGPDWVVLREDAGYISANDGRGYLMLYTGDLDQLVYYRDNPGAI